MIDQGLEIIKTYYGHLLDSGATTTWENYNANKNYSQSLSHGWGSSPTWFLTTYVLGAKRTGLNTWQFSPREDLVENMSGSLPLKDGLLHVAWKHDGCQSLTLNVSSPNMAEGEIVLSNREGMKEIKKKGEVIWKIGDNFNTEVFIESDIIRIYLSGGDHYLSVQRDC